MKFSKYNLLIQNKNDNILFNTFTGEVYKLDEKTYLAIKEDKIDFLDKNLLKTFINSKIIIDENTYDEDRIFRYYSNLNKYSRTSLVATILLTWACNFKCIYCYEGAGEKFKHTMTKETADSVVKFLINTANNNSLNRLHIILFGGEPLLNIDIGFYILEKLKSYCTDNNKILSCSMVSNGYLLNREIIENLIKYNCDFIQITLDGTPEIHNNRRIAKDGSNTFDTIINNIKILDEYYDKIKCIIRINIDKKNYKEVVPLLELLKYNNIINAKVDFGIVHNSTEACKDYNNNCFSEEELGDLLDEMWNNAKRYSFSRYPRLNRKFNFCGLYCNYNYAISPKGELYKCWEMVGDEKHKMANIDTNGNTVDLKYNFFEWMTVDPLNNSECNKCVYLPLCGGGCAMYSLKKTGNYDGNGCFRIKGVIEKQILNYVYEYEDR